MSSFLGGIGECIGIAGGVKENPEPGNPGNETNFAAFLTLGKIKGDANNPVRTYKISTPATSAEWLLTDRDGSVRQMVNSSGTINLKTDYDAYGNATYSNTTVTPSLQGYTGQTNLSLLGLYSYGNGTRIYDPKIGRFMTADPAQSGTNPYEYANNDPIDYTDPTGLTAFTSGGVGSRIPSGLISQPNLAGNPISTSGPVITPASAPIRDPLPALEQSLAANASSLASLDVQQARTELAAMSAQESAQKAALAEVVQSSFSDGASAQSAIDDVATVAPVSDEQVRADKNELNRQLAQADAQSQLQDEAQSELIQQDLDAQEYQMIPAVKIANFINDAREAAGDLASGLTGLSRNTINNIASTANTVLTIAGAVIPVIGEVADLGLAADLAAADATAEGRITYGALDELGRPTGVNATITQDMIGTGTYANPNIVPPGWSGNGNVFNEARGHLLGRQLGGSGDILENLVTQQGYPANSRVQQEFEGLVRDAVEGGQTVNYSAIPIYNGNNLAPRGITLFGSGSGGFQLGVSILNPVGR